MLFMNMQNTNMSLMTISSNLGHNFFGIVGLVFGFIYLAKYYEIITQAQFKNITSAPTTLVGIIYLLGLLASSDFSGFGEIHDSVTQHILLAIIITAFGAASWINRAKGKNHTVITTIMYLGIGILMALHNHQTGHDAVFGDSYHRLLAAISLTIAGLHGLIYPSKAKPKSLYAINSVCFWLIGVLLFIYKSGPHSH